MRNLLIYPAAEVALMTYVKLDKLLQCPIEKLLYMQYVIHELECIEYMATPAVNLN